jgi:hypothetical protein
MSNAARKLSERGSAYKQLMRDEVALLTPELAPGIMMQKLIAKHGHAEVFRRHGPTARRLHRASNLWILAHESGERGRGRSLHTISHPRLSDQLI